MITVVGGDGNLWFSINRQSVYRCGGIGRITPTGVITEFELPICQQAYGITPGPGGNIWFTAGPDIGYVTTSGDMTEWELHPGPSVWSGIVEGPDGAIWFSAGMSIGRSSLRTRISTWILPSRGLTRVEAFSGRTVLDVAPDTILGRDEELAVVHRFFDREPDGPRALLLEGDAGIGKSTIWQEAVRLARASGIVLLARAAETEATLSFTVLADLLEPVSGQVFDELPVPQRRALQAALLLEDPDGSTRPDARAVALGALGAIRSLATQGPVTLAIDDVQWVDASSAHALAFALRRLIDERVTVIAALRVAPGLRAPLTSALPGLQRLSLGPIDTAAVGGMLRRRLDPRFPHPLVERIHAASGGNPLFALEVGRAIDLDGVPPGAGEPLPVPDDLRVLLRERVATLPADAQDVLLIAASSTSPTIDQVEALGASTAALDRAVEAGIVVLRGRTIEFAHPLFASTVYADATVTAKREVHRRLAELATDSEEKARHLALSSSGPNEEVAVALDRAAARARARGAPQAGADLFELALAATPVDDLPARTARAISLAGNLIDAGDPARARRILEHMIAELPPGPSRAEALGVLSLISWKDLGRVAELLQTALEEVGDDRSLRAWFLADLAWVELGSGDLVAAGERARAAARLAEQVDDEPYVLRLSLSILALTEFLSGRPARHLLERAISIQSRFVVADTVSAAMCLGRLLTWEGQLGAACEVFESELIRYREQGQETACYEILVHLAEAECRAGRLGLAARHVAEAEDVATDGGVDAVASILPLRAHLECVAGEMEAARRGATEGLAVCERSGDRWDEIRCRSVLGLIELSLEDPAAAHGWLEPLAGFTASMGLREPSVFPFVPDEVEALVALGELDQAKALTQHLEEQGAAQDRPLALGAAARCRGLISAKLGDLPGAAVQLERSLDVLERAAQPFDLARSLLVAGEIQRRMKKKSSARELLGRGLAIFDGLGATLWSERARRELARIGGRRPSANELTPTEAEVARLVAMGRTNREVADALFVSVHTVEANLKRIYGKLQVRSRTELARKL